MKRKFIILCTFIVTLSICITVFGATGIDMKNDVTTATVKNYGAPKSESTTSSGWGDIIGDVVGGIGSDSSGDIGDMLGGVDTSGLGDTIGGFGDSLGGIGDALGGVGDAFGGIADGIGDAMGGIFGGGFGGNSSSGTTVTANTNTNTTNTANEKTTEPVSTTVPDLGLIIPVPAATQAKTEVITIISVVSETQVSGETVDYSATSNPYTKPTKTFVAGEEDETIKWLQWIFIYTGFGLNDNSITGVLDEDTVAVVKKLQHENNLTVDGNITEDVIKAAEVLYYQSVVGGDVSAIEVSSDATTGESVSNQNVTTGDGDGIPVVLLIVVLVIIWVLAIGGIVIIFIFKKKKMKALKSASAEKAEGESADADKKENGEKNEINVENKTDGENEIKSLSDLFEEAESKGK